MGRATTPASAHPGTVDADRSGIGLIGRPARHPAVRPSSLRQYVDGRGRDLAAWLAQVSDRLGRLQVERQALDERLEERNGLRRMVLANSRRFTPEDVADVVGEVFGLSEDAARLDVHIEALEDRLAGLAQQWRVMRILSQQLDAIAGLDSTAIPDRVRRHQRALRELFGLVDAAYERAERDLFEGPMQSLGNVLLEADVAERRGVTAEDLAALRHHVRDAFAELLRLASYLSPMLAGAGLIAAMRVLARNIAVDHDVSVRVHAVGAERPLPTHAMLVLHRVVHEALANAARHSGAATVDVVLTHTPVRVTAMVRDGGEGFDVVATEARLGRGAGMGLITMREYALAMDAPFEIRSRIGAGTEVRITVQV